MQHRPARATVRRHALWPVLPLVAALHATSASADGAGVFQLGEVEVTAPGALAAEAGASVVTADDMAAQNDLTIGQALQGVPGVTTISTGKRNEMQADIRGFSPQQITLNIDGIPIYVPYDGNVDLSRLLVPGVSEIVVTKGLGSLMYGPNNMGGSINVVTTRPTRSLEGDVGGGITANQDRIDGADFSAQIGSRIDARWYVQAGVSENDLQTYPLSHDFAPVAAQPAGNRLNAVSRDLNANLKVGFTPNATDDYAIGLYEVESMKQSPPYAGHVQSVSYWDWPQWDKTSVYYIGNTAIGAGYLKTRLYHDGFVNQLDSYDNALYDSTARRYAFLSKYDDYANGGSAELGQPLGETHFLKAAVFVKEDVHRETEFPSTVNPVVSPWLFFRTHTGSAGLEDTWTLSPATRVVAGYRYDVHHFDQANRYANASNDTGVASWPLSGPQSANNEQVELTHDLDGVALRAGIGDKTRFPGIKDMYSSALGSGVPNPSLSAEHALNREIGGFGHLPGGGDLDVALYWDTIGNAIESVAVAPQSPYCAANCTQNQNVGSATNRGMDVTLHQPLGSSLLLTATYSYLDAQLGATSLVPTNAPRHAGGLSLAWFESARTELDADVRAASGRQSATNGLQPVGGYATVDLRAVEHIDAHWTVDTRLGNLFDRNYALTEGYPMPGRTLQVQANYAF